MKEEKTKPLATKMLRKSKQPRAAAAASTHNSGCNCKDAVAHHEADRLTAVLLKADAAASEGCVGQKSIIG